MIRVDDNNHPTDAPAEQLWIVLLVVLHVLYTRLICLLVKLFYSPQRPYIRDFPDGVGPTTAVGLSDDSIADREIGKHDFCSAQGVS